MSQASVTQHVVPGQTRRLGVAVVGAGRWGQNLVRAFASLDRGRLVAVCDVDETRLSSVPRALRRETDFRSVLRNPDVGAVVVATPPRTHAELVIAALEAKKHVFVEKPMALSLPDALRIRACALAQDRRVMVGFVLQYHPAVCALRRLAEQAALGSVTDLFAQRGGVRQNHDDHPAWWSLAPHDVSLAYVMFGTSARRVAIRRCEPSADAVSGRVDFAGARAAWLAIDANSANRSRRVVIVGTRATAVFDDLLPREKVRIYPLPNQSGRELPAIEHELSRLTPQAPAFAADEPLRVEAQHFVDRIVDGGPFRSDLDHGVDVISVLAAGQRSIASHGAPVDVTDWRVNPAPP